MRYLIILLFAFTVNAQEVNSDSITVELDIVEKGFYTVWLDTVEISRHTKPMKAASKANELRLKYPLADIKVTQPNLVPIGSLQVFSNSEPCLDNDILTIIKTDKSTVTIEFPKDDTGTLIVNNPELKTIKALGKTYTNTKYLEFVQYDTGWELLK